MTDLIPGKRYRWTVDGVAEGNDLRLSNLGLIDGVDLEQCGTIELLPDPLPTTPGSVVWTEIRPFMLGLSGEWADEDGDHAEVKWLNNQKIVRTFDAGAPRD